MLALNFIKLLCRSDEIAALQLVKSLVVNLFDRPLDIFSDLRSFAHKPTTRRTQHIQLIIVSTS